MPESWIVVAGAATAGFLIGSINPASIIARFLHQDLRQGSGNPGATNASRVLGLRWGIIVGLIDVLKGFLPTFLALWLFDRSTAYVVGLATVLGHVLSPFLRGRGGRGVATSLGALIAVFPWFALGTVVVFGVMLWATRWVAGSSIAAAALLGLYAGLGPLPDPVVAGRVWGICIALIVIVRHYDNIRGWVDRRLV
ncbi:MAG: glycerol-3-phosphate acyltransferase [Dermatophilaceae bacterium]|nr:glycerol-3-phosphate acyltransferase [Dermatophilaceae bacterium]